MSLDDFLDEFPETPDVNPFNHFPTFRKNKNLENLDVVILDRAAAFVHSEDWQPYQILVSFVGRKIINGIHYREIKLTPVDVTKKRKKN